jgi:hypothetical protein
MGRRLYPTGAPFRDEPDSALISLNLRVILPGSCSFSEIMRPPRPLTVGIAGAAPIVVIHRPAKVIPQERFLHRNINHGQRRLVPPAAAPLPCAFIARTSVGRADALLGVCPMINSRAFDARRRQPDSRFDDANMMGEALLAWRVRLLRTGMEKQPARSDPGRSRLDHLPSRTPSGLNGFRGSWRVVRPRVKPMRRP